MSKLTRIWKRGIRPQLLAACKQNVVAAPKSAVTAADVVNRYAQVKYVADPVRSDLALPAREIIDSGGHLKALRDAQGGSGQQSLVQEATHVKRLDFAIAGPARIAGNDGAVISPDNALIADVSGVKFQSGDILDPLSTGHLKPAIATEHPVALATCWRSDNYYHWLVDGLARLRLTEPHITPETRVYAPQRKHFQRQSLACLGYAADRIVTAKYAAHIESQRVVAPASSTQNSCREDIDFLHNRFTGALTGDRCERIFLSRRKRGIRALLNESEVLACLKPLGFRRVLLEDLPFAEQVKLFHSAEVVVAPHGAGLANLAFCQAGANVLEITTPYRVYGYHCFWEIAHYRDLNYRALVGQPVNARDIDLSIGPGDSDIVAPPEQVLAHVHQLLDTPGKAAAA